MSDEIHDNSFEHVSTIMQPSTPVRWTPEDAANFISATIHEAQRPTMQALKSRGVSKFIYFISCLFLLALAGGIFYYFGFMREAEWKKQVQYLTNERDSIQNKHNELLEKKLDATVKVTTNLIDNTQLSKELNAARKEIGANKTELERLQEKGKDLAAENKKLTDERDVARGEVVELKSVLKKSEADIAHINDIKSAHSKELVKLNKHLNLLRLANDQQKGEIDILRQRLSTAQKMVNNLGEENAVEGNLIKTEEKKENSEVSK